MPLTPAKCPQCGAQLKVNSEQDAAICEYCNTPFIVEKAINNYNITNNFDGANVVIHEADITSLENLIKLAQQALRDDNYNKASEYFNDVLLRDPDNIEAYFYSKYCSVYADLVNLPLPDIKSLGHVASNTIYKICNSNMDTSDKVSFTTKIVYNCQKLAGEFNNIVFQKEQEAIKKDKNNYEISLDPEKVAKLLLLDIADALYNCYPNDENYQSMFIPIWKNIADTAPQKDIRISCEKKVQKFDKSYTSAYSNKAGCGCTLLLVIPGIIFLLNGVPHGLIFLLLAVVVYWWFNNNID